MHSSRTPELQSAVNDDPDENDEPKQSKGNRSRQRVEVVVAGYAAINSTFTAAKLFLPGCGTLFGVNRTFCPSFIPSG
jgi:hypothetical protein